MGGFQQPLTDGQILDILDRVDRQGQSMAEVGARYGVSRSAIAGVLKRVRDDLTKSELAPLPRGSLRAYWPENQDGALGPRWWEAGLRAREAQRYSARRVSA